MLGIYLANFSKEGNLFKISKTNSFIILSLISLGRFKEFESIEETWILLKSACPHKKTDVWVFKRLIMTLYFGSLLGADLWWQK